MSSPSPSKVFVDTRGLVRHLQRPNETPIATSNQSIAERRADGQLQEDASSQELPSDESATLTNQQLQEREKQVAALESKIRSYELELIEADATLQDTRTRHKASMQELMTSHASEVTRLQSEIEVAKQSTQAAATERDQARGTLQEREDKERQELQPHSQTATQRASTAVTDGDSAQETLGQNQDKDGQATNVIESSEILDAKDKEITALQDKVRSLETINKSHIQSKSFMAHQMSENTRKVTQDKASKIRELEYIIKGYEQAKSAMAQQTAENAQKVTRLQDKVQKLTSQKTTMAQLLEHKGRELLELQQKVYAQEKIIQSSTIPSDKAALTAVMEGNPTQHQDKDLQETDVIESSDILDAKDKEITALQDKVRTLETINKCQEQEMARQILKTLFQSQGNTPRSLIEAHELLMCQACQADIKEKEVVELRQRVTFFQSQVQTLASQGTAALAAGLAQARDGHGILMRKERKLLELQQKVTSLQNQVQTMTARQGTAEADLAHACENLERKDKELGELQEKVASLQDLVQALTSHSKDLQNSIDLRGEALTQQATKITSLQSQVQAPRNQGTIAGLAKARVLLERKDRELGELRKEVVSLQDQLQAKQALQSNPKSTASELQRLEETHQKKVATLNNTIRELEGTIACHETEVQQVKMSRASRVTSMKSDMEKLKKSARATGIERDRAREKLVELQQRFGSMECEMEEMTSVDQVRKDEEILKLEERIGELQSEVQIMRSIFEQCEQSKNTIAQQLETQMKAHATYREKLEQKEREYDLIRQSLAQRISDYGVLKEDNDERREMIRKLQLQIDGYAAKEILQKATQQNVEKLESDVSCLSKLVQEKDKLISSNATEISKLKDEHEKLNKAMQIMSKKKQKYKTTIAQLKETIRSLETNLDEKRNIHSLVQKSKEEGDEGLAEGASNQPSDSGPSPLVENNNAKLTADVEALQKENRLLQDTNNALVTELVERDNAIQNLESDLKENKALILDMQRSPATKLQTSTIKTRTNDENLPKEIDRLRGMVKEQRSEIERLMEKDSAIGTRTVWAQHNYACVEWNEQRRVSMSPPLHSGRHNLLGPMEWNGSSQLESQQLQGHPGGPGKEVYPSSDAGFPLPQADPSFSTKRAHHDSDGDGRKKAKVTHLPLADAAVPSSQGFL